MNDTIKNAGLSEREVELLQALNEQTELIEAIRKVISVGIQSNGVTKANAVYNPMFNWAIQIAQAKDKTNEQIGESTRAVAEGLMMLQLGINEILLFKRAEEKTTKTNKAV